MWTSTLDLSINRVLLTKLLGLVYPNVYYSSLSPLRVANIPRPTLPSANWVRVRNRLGGICGSDLHLVYADADPRISVAAIPNYRHIYPGHEVVGEVIEIGEDVQHLNVGDRVALQYAPNCMSTGAKPICRACASGNYNLCEYGTLPGPQTIGGGWSEEMLLHEQQLFRLPIELSDEQGVMIEPTAVALHAILRHLPQAEDNILIIGAGTIGLLTLQVLRTLVPKARISMLVRHPFQIEQATRLGADNTIHSTDPYTSIQRATQARLYKGILNNRTLVGGYDVIYDTVGQQKTLHHALRWLRSQGTLVMVGLSLHMMNIDLTPIWHQEAHLLGSLSHGIETWPPKANTNAGENAGRRSTFSIVTELIEQKRLQPEQLITHRFALNNYKEALKSASQKKSHQSVKVLFDYSLLPASAVPNVRASARPHRPALSQPRGDAFMEEFLKSQPETLPQQDPEKETVSEPSQAQQTIPPKILNTPPPQALTKESWRTILSQQDIDQDDGYEDEDTDTAIPIVKRPPYTPRVNSRFTQSPQTPMPMVNGSATDQTRNVSANQTSATAKQQNWQINVRKQPEKQTNISPTPKTDISVQQQSADETLRFANSAFKSDAVPVTSLPSEDAPEPIEEAPEANIDASEKNSSSIQPAVEIQSVEEDENANDSKTPAQIQDSQDASLSEMIPTLPTSATSLVQETDSTDDGEAIQADDVQTPTDTIIAEATPSAIEPVQTEDALEEEHTTTYNGQIDHADLLDFLRYLPPLEPTYPTYQPTQTLPAEIEQVAFPTSNDQTALKLPANNGEHSSPFSETINMDALTEEQLPNHNILDNLFDADTSSMPAFLAHLSDFGAPIVPEKSIEDAEAPTLPDLVSDDMPTQPDLVTDDVPTLPNLALSDKPTLLNTTAVALPDSPTLVDESIVMPPTDVSVQADGTLVSSTPKAKKKSKLSRSVRLSTPISTNVELANKLTREAEPEQLATPTTQDQAATDTSISDTDADDQQG